MIILRSWSNSFYFPLQNACRYLTCSPGKVLVNNSCAPLLKFTTNLCYIFAVGIEATVYNNPFNIKGVQLHQVITSEAINHLQSSAVKGKTNQHIRYLISNTPCHLTSSYLEGYLYLEICTTDIVNRLLVEESLLQARNSTFVDTSPCGVNISFRMDNNAFRSPVLVNSLAMTERCIYEKTSKLSNHIALPVNDLLLCTQLEFDVDEYSDNGNFVIVNGYSIDQNDFMRIKDKIRLCADFYSKLKSIKTKDDHELLTSVTRLLCSFVSLVCLIATFVTYALFKSLRTIPGVNNMILVLCLTLNTIVFLIRWFEKPRHEVCQIIGVLQHYFFLCTFTSFNICTYHVFRVFTSNIAIQTHSRFSILCKYSTYIFGFPALIVCCNVVITYFVEHRQSIGYGGDLCFIILKTAAIVTLLLPIGIILLMNLVMFAAAVLHICRQPDLSEKSTKRQKRNDLVIYFKLFTITGCSWIFQFVDAFFPETFFSVLISICNMLTGVFIFTSYICNHRVYNLYKMKLTGRTAEKYKTTSTTNGHTQVTTK